MQRFFQLDLQISKRDKVYNCMIMLYKGRCKVNETTSMTTKTNDDDTNNSRRFGELSLGKFYFSNFKYPMGFSTNGFFEDKRSSWRKIPKGNDHPKLKSMWESWTIV